MLGGTSVSAARVNQNIDIGHCIQGVNDVDCGLQLSTLFLTCIIYLTLLGHKFYLKWLTSDIFEVLACLSNTDFLFPFMQQNLVISGWILTSDSVYSWRHYNAVTLRDQTISTIT